MMDWQTIAQAADFFRERGREVMLPDPQERRSLERLGGKLGCTGDEVCDLVREHMIQERKNVTALCAFCGANLPVDDMMMHPDGVACRPCAEDEEQ